MRHSMIVAVALLAAACGKVPSDTPSGDTVARPAQSVAGAARVRGGTFEIDVQVGDPLAHPTVQGGAITADDGVLGGAAAREEAVR